MVIAREEQHRFPKQVRLAKTVVDPDTSTYPSYGSAPNAYWIVFLDGEYTAETQGSLTPTYHDRQTEGATTALNVLPDNFCPVGTIVAVWFFNGKWWFKYHGEKPVVIRGLTYTAVAEDDEVYNIDGVVVVQGEGFTAADCPGYVSAGGLVPVNNRKGITHENNELVYAILDSNDPVGLYTANYDEFVGGAGGGISQRCIAIVKGAIGCTDATGKVDGVLPIDGKVSPVANAAEELAVDNVHQDRFHDNDEVVIEWNNNSSVWCFKTLEKFATVIRGQATADFSGTDAVTIDNIQVCFPAGAFYIIGKETDSLPLESSATLNVQNSQAKHGREDNKVTCVWDESQGYYDIVSCKPKALRCTCQLYEELHGGDSSIKVDTIASADGGTTPANDTGQTYLTVYNPRHLCGPNNAPCEIQYNFGTTHWELVWVGCPTMIRGLATAAVATTDGTFYIDGVVVMQGYGAAADCLGYEATGTKVKINNYFAWEGDDNAPCVAALDQTATSSPYFIAINLKCPV